MKAGEVSDVIRTQQGFVILKVVEHHDAGVPPLSEVEPRVQDALYMKKLQPALREYLTKLREDAYIDIKPGYVDYGCQPKSDQARRDRVRRSPTPSNSKRRKNWVSFRLSLA